MINFHTISKSLFVTFSVSLFVLLSGDVIAQAGCGSWSGVQTPYRIWDGSDDDNWQNAANWTPFGVPNNTHYVYIPSGCGTQPTLYGDGSSYPAADCYAIEIHSSGGAELTWNTSTAVLNVQGSW